jgi:hypothetical protein
MSNLYEILAGAQQGKAMFGLGREFGLSPEQTQAAVTALLPAISMGLKQSTATPEGLEELFALMGRQPDLNAMYSKPDVAFSPDGRKAGNEVFSAMFGSPDASRAVADQAQQYSGVTSDILKKLLPILAWDSHFRPDAERIGTGSAAGASASSLSGRSRWRNRRHSKGDIQKGCARGRSSRIFHLYTLQLTTAGW